jgi:DNA processing protein
VNERIEWLALSAVPGVGPGAFRALLKRFGGPREAMEAPLGELVEVPRVNGEIAEAIRAAPATFDRLAEEVAGLSEEDIDFLTWEDDAYPARLRTIPQSPPILWVRGALLPDDERAAAVIGSRACSEDGFAVARQIACALAEAGVTVVSGLAEGIDTAAHLGALDGRGRTLAVLGSGVRVVTPRANWELAERITAAGALLSELRPNTPPATGALFARDRIISGLSRAVVLVEGAADSGSQDTCRHARKQHRGLFVVDWGRHDEARAANAEVLAHATALSPEGDVAPVLEFLGQPEEPAEPESSEESLAFEF